MCPPQVIFRDPDAAARAVQNPNPVIAGRRANCNIAAFAPARASQQPRGGERPEEPNQINAPPAVFFTFLALARHAHVHGSNNRGMISAGGSTAINRISLI